MAEAIPFVLFFLVLSWIVSMVCSCKLAERKGLDTGPHVFLAFFLCFYGTLITACCADKQRRKR